MTELLAAPLLEQIDFDLMERIDRLRKLDIIPRLEIVNDNLEYHPSVMYSHLKVKTALKLGMLANLTEDPDTNALADKIRQLNEDDSVHGVIVQASRKLS